MKTTEIVSRKEELGEVVVRVARPLAGGATRVLGVIPLQPGETIVVGSSAPSDLVVSEPTVSQRHLKIEHKRTHVLTTDLGSKNGTQLFGQRVSSAGVGPGVPLTIGYATVEIQRSEPNGRPHALAGLIGRSEPMQALAERIRRFAVLDEPVLIRGESGTGKELVARALHTLAGNISGPSRRGRCRGPFVAINAASLSRDLAESELFGHRRGAFTGAVSERLGAFREASGGTLFIDEIAQLGTEVQAKLLRAVEEGIVRPLGADGSTRVDVRLVVATCEPLERLVDERRFRMDLYERIAVCVVRVPPLRERLSDVPELAEHLMGTLGLDPVLLQPCAVRALTRGGDYRGNVRELRSVLLHASIAAGPHQPILEDHVNAARGERKGRDPSHSAEALACVLEACGGNVSAAARRLGLPRSTLRDWVAAQKRPPTAMPPSPGPTTGTTISPVTPDAVFSSLCLELPYQSTIT